MDAAGVEDARAARHRRVSAALATWSDERLGAALAGDGRGGVGIGGTTARLDIAGEPVFAKAVAVTERELADGHVRSTANVFDLPSWYQYGVGSAGFGAWRELRAHELATEWVLDGACGNFPLLHHSRVLRQPPHSPASAADIDRAVRFWGDSPAVRRRLQELAQAPAVLVLLLEHIPETLHDWLIAQLAHAATAAEACAFAEAQLLAAVRCMGAHQLSHFDAHFRNVLTDGSRVYVGDFGLAASVRFETDAAERRFLDRTAQHDRAYVMTHLVNTVVGELVAPGGVGARNAYVRRCAQEAAAPGLPAAIADLVCRHAPLAALLIDFYWRLHAGEVGAPYPAGPIARALAEVS